MIKWIIISLFPMFTFAQVDRIMLNGGQTPIYSDAITRYIDSVRMAGKPAIDTLIVLKDGAFLESSIQNVIQSSVIVLEDTISISNQFKIHKPFTALNISPNKSSGKDRINIVIATFLVTTDSQKIIYTPTESCYVSYMYNDIKKEFEFKKLVCDN